MIDRYCSVIVNKNIGEDEIEVKMKKRLAESYEDFYGRVMKELGNIFPDPNVVYKAREYHE